MLLASITLPVNADIPEKKLEQLMDKTGISEQIRQLPEIMQSSIEQLYNDGKCNEITYRIISRAIKRSFEPDFIARRTKYHMQQRLDEASVNHMLDWYKTDLGKKILKLESSSHDKAAIQDMLNRSDILFANQNRVQTATKIGEITDTLDWAVNIQMQSRIALLGAIAETQKIDITDTLLGIALEIDKQKNMLRPLINQSINLWYLYTYEDLDKNEMQAYLDFLQTPETDMFNSLSLDSLANAITETVERFIVTVADIIEEDKGETDY